MRASFVCVQLRVMHSERVRSMPGRLQAQLYDVTVVVKTIAVPSIHIH